MILHQICLIALLLLLPTISGKRGRGSIGRKRTTIHGIHGGAGGNWMNNNDTQSRLIFQLLTSYNPKVRPVWDFRDKVVIHLNMKPYQLLDVDEVNQCIITSMWMTETWHDEYLYWNPEESDNLTELHLPHQDVWRPDTYLYNNLEMDPQTVQRLMNVIIRPNATSQSSLIKLQYPAIFRTSCIMNVANFPFDQQNCVLTFGSWTHDNTEIDFQPEQNNISLFYFIQNQEFDIVSFYAERRVEIYDCCPKPYTVVIYHLTIQRKPLFYIVNLIIPSVIVAFINYIGFFTPTSSSGERGEKVTLGLTTLLALAVLLLQLTDHTPHSSISVSLLGWFILGLILLVGAGTVMTVIVIHLQHKGECHHPPTPLLRFILCTIGWIICHPTCASPKTKPKYSYTKQSPWEDSDMTDNSSRPDQKLLKPPDNHNGGLSFCNLLDGTTGTNNDQHSRCPISAANSDNSSVLSSKERQREQALLLQHSIWTLTQQSIRELQRISSHLTAEKELLEAAGGTEATSTGKSDWILAAAALERLCLVVFCSSTVLITVMILIVGHYRTATNG